MRKLFALSLPAVAMAYPSVMEALVREKMAASNPLTKRADNATQQISIDQHNCGPQPCATFDEAEQFVSTSGEHAFVAPGPNDLRGPCPGLNAAANHGYLPHNGIASLADTVDGLVSAFGFGADNSAILAAYSIAQTGDPLTLRWSIGGPLPRAPLLGGNGKGLTFSHNRFEGDTSFSRHDAYLAENNGDVFDINRVKAAINFAGPSDRITLDTLRQVYAQNLQTSITKNPM